VFFLLCAPNSFIFSVMYGFKYECMTQYKPLRLSLIPLFPYPLLPPHSIPKFPHHLQHL
jgi:hypothetical protein